MRGFLFLGFKNTDAALSPKIDALFAAIDDGTFNDMYATETTPELRTAATRKEWEQLGLLIKTRLGPLKSKSLTRFSVQQFNADFCTDAVYSATFEKGTGEILTRFRSIDGDWRLVVFRVNSPEFLTDLSTIACPFCGEACPASAKFCPKCGKPLADHGKHKPAAKKDGRRGKDSAAKAAPSKPPAPPAR